jgi:hypothetical protein
MKINFSERRKKRFYGNQYVKFYFRKYIINPIWETTQGNRLPDLGNVQLYASGLHPALTI